LDEEDRQKKSANMSTTTNTQPTATPAVAPVLSPSALALPPLALPWLLLAPAPAPAPDPEAEGCDEDEGKGVGLGEDEEDEDEEDEDSREEGATEGAAEPRLAVGEPAPPAPAPAPAAPVLVLARGTSVGEPAIWNMLVVGWAEGASEGTAGLGPQKQPLPQVWKKPQRGARAGGEGQLREQGMKSWAADEGKGVGGMGAWPPLP
jgi:hypothetical protein